MGGSRGVAAEATDVAGFGGSIAAGATLAGDGAGMAKGGEVGVPGPEEAGGRSGGTGRVGLVGVGTGRPAGAMTDFAAGTVWTGGCPVEDGESVSPALGWTGPCGAAVRAEFAGGETPAASMVNES
jgi:hypothetical protein